ncbi:hypothetical protein V490_00164 [Pseudogymnoascus sp. VKM F-3557]|nr:hypothetical protein V490_00164 [Pseudogymnoascus sp. VKM F-3557]
MDVNAAQRRKVRKGTRSCWDCKRRKVRCIFMHGDDTVCISCRRRGTRCVGQEYPEEGPLVERRGREADRRIVRIEAMIEHVARKVDATDDTTEDGAESRSAAGRAEAASEPSVHAAQVSRLGTSAVQSLAIPDNPERSPRTISVPVTTVTEFTTMTPLILPSPSFGSPFSYMPSHESRTSVDKWAEVSLLLYDALPSDDDVHRILTTDSAALFFIPYCLTAPEPEQMSRPQSKTADLTVRPEPWTHPVLLARWMLKLVNLLQAILFHYTYDHGLSEAPMLILKRLVDKASSLVTTKDELINSAEALEAIMLEGIYQANIGNLRRAWVSFRRALAAAQLMELNKPCSRSVEVLDSSTKVDQFYTWSRIVFVDRHFSLMLGLPQGCSEQLDLPHSAPQRDESSTAELEVAHSEVASRIIQRNEQRSLKNIPLTMAIDRQLQNAANRMPSKWWLAPSLAKDDCSDTADMFRVESHLTKQIFHYNLVNQLHLPYLLGSLDGRSYTYSRYACVAASREIINRYLALPSIIRIVFCFRAIEFFVHMAAVTLLLAHIDSCRRPHEYDVGGGTGGGNLLLHQRLADRAVIELVLNNMKSSKRFSHDHVSNESHDLLSRLLAIEGVVKEHRPVFSGTTSEARVLSLTIPYFGIVNIGPDGLYKQPVMHSPIEKEPAALGSTNVFLGYTTSHRGPLPDSTMSTPTHTSHNRSTLDGAAGSSTMLSQDGMALEVTQQNDVTEQVDLSLYPGLMASADDWAFQGVDLAFFDSLMRNNSLASNTMAIDEQQQQQHLGVQSWQDIER